MQLTEYLSNNPPAQVIKARNVMVGTILKIKLPEAPRVKYWVIKSKELNKVYIMQLEAITLTQRIVKPVKFRAGGGTRLCEVVQAYQVIQ